MAETTLTDRILDTLVDAGFLTTEQVASVRASAADGTPVGRILADRGLVTSADVGSALEDELGVPRVDLSSYAPDEEALQLVPGATARGRRVLPLFEIDGTLTVAVGDPMDTLMLDDLGRELSVELDPVLTDATSLLAAIAQYYGEEQGAPVDGGPSGDAAQVPPEDEVPLPPAAEGTVAPAVEVGGGEVGAAVMAEEIPLPPSAVPSGEDVSSGGVPAATIETIAAEAPAGPAAIDLEVLAVADATKVALLVTDIMVDAASRGASRVHLLPYKDDFFLVYRVKGRLEKIASAPLSLEGALVEGFRSFARAVSGGAGAPVVGRIRTRLADQDLVLTLSAVPTIAGQRVVMSLAPFRSEPRGLGSLGMGEAEVKALHAMVERGRGILLVAAPVAEGVSATYNALIAHAAAAGKTVYSVERSIEYDIPAVAQVLVNPGSPVASAAYVTAGIRQDTDAIAIDGMSTAEDVTAAIEAAGAGRLVIATYAAGDIVSAVRRMLDLGVEPHGLASALTLAVGQRLVQANCPKCVAEKPSAALVLIPGASKGVTNRAGAGCPSCAMTGFAGATGIFEVLPFTETVRGAVARGASADELAKAAAAAGMRAMSASGLAKVAAGTVNADELARVLRLQ